MNVAFCADNKYAIPCAVSLVSLLENNEGCLVFILCKEMNAQNRKVFEWLTKSYSTPISIVEISDNTLSCLKISNRFPTSIYYRFLLPHILTDETKVLYLDCDVIVRGSLKELYQTTLKDCACAVIEEQSSDDIANQNRIGIYDSPYFNSGVMLMNLEYWRDNNVCDKLVDFIYQNPEKCLYPDQDALNILLGRNVRYVDFKYNYQHLFYGDISELRLRREKIDYIKSIANDAVIVHYTGHDKPWNVICGHSHADYFWQYADKHDIVRLSLRKNHSYSLGYRIVMKFISLLYRLSEYLK